MSISDTRFRSTSDTFAGLAFGALFKRSQVHDPAPATRIGASPIEMSGNRSACATFAPCATRVSRTASITPTSTS